MLRIPLPDNSTGLWSGSLLCSTGHRHINVDKHLGSPYPTIPSMQKMWRAPRTWPLPYFSYMMIDTSIHPATVIQRGQDSIRRRYEITSSWSHITSSASSACRRILRQLRFSVISPRRSAEYVIATWLSTGKKLKKKSPASQSNR